MQVLPVTDIDDFNVSAYVPNCLTFTKWKRGVGRSAVANQAWTTTALRDFKDIMTALLPPGLTDFLTYKIRMLQLYSPRHWSIPETCNARSISGRFAESGFKHHSDLQLQCSSWELESWQLFRCEWKFASFLRISKSWHVAQEIKKYELYMH